MPDTTDGSVLIVAGDVTGKGLKAGMLVALLVGAIRSTAEVEPDRLYAAGVEPTAAGARRCPRHLSGDAALLADGEVMLANAGHMPPYLNGKPVVMEGALPLGMMRGA